MIRTCSIEGCDRPHVARGWCRNHYARWHATGDPNPTRLYGAPVAERLLSKLKPAENGCLVFTGWTDQRGYGRFKVDGSMRKPHRVAYELWVGPIKDGLFVCHHCDNPPCCNPEHLFQGTGLDNMRDMAEKGRGDTSGLACPPDQGDRLRASAARRRAATAVAAGHPSDWKLCARCDTYKAPTGFGSNAARPDGLQTYCRPCLAEYAHTRRTTAP